MKISTLKKIVVATFFFVSSTYASEIKYQLRGYGGSHVVIILNGSQSEKLIVNPSTDGTSVRISGVDTTFIQNDSSAPPSLISSLRQVRRGSLTDLVLNLSSPSLVSATPSLNSLKVYIKSKGKSVEPAPEATSLSTNESSPVSENKILPTKIIFPIKIFFDKGTDSQQLSPTLALVFPSSARLQSKVSLVSELRSAAFVIETIWAWANGEDYPQPNTTDSSHEDAKESKNKELESLVQDLTKEIVQLRELLSIRDKEIESLRHGK